MSKLATLNPEESLAPFKRALGKNFDKVINDVKSMLGRVEKDLKITQKKWKATASFVLTSSEGQKLQLPANNPAAHLLCFGMRLNELSSNGEFEIEAEIPKPCIAWVEQHSREVAAAKEQTQAKA